jgi:hypothetical protein
MKGYLGCMALTHEYGLRHFPLKNNDGYDNEVLAYMYEDSSCFGIGAWLMYLLGTSDGTC